MKTKGFVSTALTALVVVSSCQMPRNQVLVLNMEGTPTSFGVSCDDRLTWKPATLEAHARQRYQCDSPGDKMWVHLNTDLPGEVHQESQQQVTRGQRYAVYFDRVSINGISVR